MVVPGVAVHVIQRGNNRQPIFFASDDYGKFLEDLGVTSQAYSCEIHAYVLMTNHVHLLLTPKIAGAVSQMMQALGRRYVRYINGTFRRSGTLSRGTKEEQDGAKRRLKTLLLEEFEKKATPGPEFFGSFYALTKIINRAIS